MVQEDTSTSGCGSTTAAGQATSSSPHQQRPTEDHAREREHVQNNGSGPTLSNTLDGEEASVGAGSSRSETFRVHEVPLHLADGDGNGDGAGASEGDGDDYEDDETDEDSLAAIEADLSLLQRYNANTSARGVVQHKRNSFVTRDDDDDGADLERRGSAGGDGDSSDGRSKDASLKPFKMQLPVQQQRIQHEQSQRRIIFPTLYSAGTKEKGQSNAASSPTEPKQSYTSPKHRRSKSCEQKPGIVRTEDLRERTMAFISTWKSPVSDKIASAKLDITSMPSNNELLDAMDDRYDPTKSKRPRSRQRASFSDIPSLPSATAAALANRVPTSTTAPIAVLSPAKSRKSDNANRFIIPPFARGGAQSLRGEAASGEIVCQVSRTNRPKDSPNRKPSLFERGSALPKVQRISSAEPDPLTPRSPPTRDTTSLPLPSILRKTSSFLNSPITPKKTGFHRATVSIGGQPSNSDGGKNLDIPHLAKSGSPTSTSSEFELVVRTLSWREEASTGSSSSLRSNTSLRRVLSENSMASSHERERKRATAVTRAAAAADGTMASDGDGTSTRKKTMARHASLEISEPKEISFDPRVWVVEYEQDEVNNWFTHEELERFKCEAIDRIRRRQAQEQLLQSGTGRIVVPRQRQGSGRALFSDPALGIGTDETEDVGVVPAAAAAEFNLTTLPVQPLLSPSNEKKLQRTLLSEIRNILVVDPHDMFLKLFAKSLHSMLSQVVVTEASSAEEALRRIAAARVLFPQSEGGATHGFDIIIVEERLQLFHCHLSGNVGAKNGPRHQQAAGDDQNHRNIPASGSALISQIVAEQKNMVSSISKRPRFSLLIGVSAHLQLDGDRLRRSGADFVWGKPPPPFGTELKAEILRGILQKRGKASFI